MAYYAILNLKNIVQSVIVVGNEIATTEQAGLIFLQDLYNDPNLVALQTSYNTRGNVHYAPNSDTPDGGVALRANYAGPGYIYDSVNDVFYSQQPYPSFILNKNTWLWEAPIPCPYVEGGPVYEWDESVKNWVAIS